MRVTIRLPVAAFVPLLTFIHVSFATIIHAPADQQRLTVQSMSTMLLAFTRNNGQWDERVLFRADAGGATMWFTREGINYQFMRRVPRVDGESAMPLPRGQ